jgi:hypothetical protein
MGRQSKLQLLCFSCVTTMALFTWVRAAGAAPTKEECLEAHGRGQDQQESGHLALARDSFAVCSQPSCPGLVQSDCARFSEELARLSPSVTFAARDDGTKDLPDTEVYVDGALVTRNLEEGRTFDIDPGRHAVRFVHRGRSVLLNVIVSEGEHGRPVVATFAERPEPALSDMPHGSTEAKHSAAKAPASVSKRGAFPLILAVGGGAALATGAVLLGVGFAKVPEYCSIQTNECAAPPGDPAFDAAHAGVSLVNAGLTTAIAGAVVGVGGLIWYFAQSPGREETPSAGLRFNGTGFSF